VDVGGEKLSSQKTTANGFMHNKAIKKLTYKAGIAPSVSFLQVAISGI
jgi:hypothetical protein